MPFIALSPPAYHLPAAPRAPTWQKQGNTEGHLHSPHTLCTSPQQPQYPARIVLILSGLGKRRQALGSQRDENAAASGVTQAEINGTPVFGVEGAHVVD